MKKIVAILVLGVGLASCGHSTCPAYNSYNQNSFDKTIYDAVHTADNTNEIKA